MAELVDAQDLKSCVLQGACGFESRSRHSKYMTSVEQHKMVQRLKHKTSKMDQGEKRFFEMIVKRDRDDEDLDSASMVKLKALYTKFFPGHSQQDIEDKWKELTGGKQD
jgi:16S rRNA G966 N2-methylase RsmD